MANTRDGLAAARARGRKGGRPSELSADQIELAQRLYDAGEHTVAQIAGMLKVPRTTVYGHLNTRRMDSAPLAQEITLADQLIRAGEFEVIIAGGQESMTQAPHMLETSRTGFKYGDVTMKDHLAYDGLYDIFTDQAMGGLTESRNEGAVASTLEEQDAFAAASHQRAATAWKNGVFDDEVVPVSIPQRKGDSNVFSQDEGIRADTTTETLAKLRPAFSETGTITAR